MSSPSGSISTSGRIITSKHASRPTTSRGYSASRSRPRTAATSTGYDDNEIICAISESRGISPTVGLSFVNLSTCEAVLCQFPDTQTYARTCHKLKAFNPSEILYMSTAADSKLISIVIENLEVETADIMMTNIHQKYWSESSGHDYVQQLAFPEDLESLKLAISGSYFAVMKYAELGLSTTFVPQTLRIKYESSEGSMMIDPSTIASLELIQNLQNNKCRDSLYGLLNETLTPMGARFLRSNILQPSTDVEKIRKIHEALTELTTKEDLFFSVRSALKSFVDIDRVLAAFVIIPARLDFHYMEQSVNNVLMLKTFVDSIKLVWQALTGCLSEELTSIRRLCEPKSYTDVEELIKYCLNDDVGYSTKPTELRNQRVYAIRAGVNGFLDVARQTFTEIGKDVFDLVNRMSDETEIDLELKFDNARQYYIRVRAADLQNRPLPEIFINTFKRGKFIECQTLDLIKMNQKMKDAHNEVINMSDHSIQQLIDNVRTKIQPLFKIGEGIAILDMLSCFAQLVTTNDYVRPEITSDRDGTLAIKAGRHPISEKILPGNSNDHPTSAADRFVPNDVFATSQTRFQIITGCNMSGKSTYIRSIALTAVMAQTGCFVPATYASVPIIHNLFARISTDDSTEATVSTFAAEMREIAFILRNLTSGSMTSQSLVLVDELGRGTSTTDGLAIAIAIAEALIESRAFVWFVTHFRDLPRILAERAGVVNLHLTVDIGSDDRDPSDYTHTQPQTPNSTLKMRMRYRIADGPSSSRFYGLALARVGGLPDSVITTATQVSQRLHERNEARKRNPRATAVLRRRKLVLSLWEQLRQARANGKGMPAGDLRAWLERLQGEFLIRMRAINKEVEAAVGYEEGHETEVDIGFGEEGGGEVSDGGSSMVLADDADADDADGHLYEMRGARGDSLLQEE
ncbi:DNA mismatch repair protein MSH4 [Exophiala aquamarina CBS 119918]|uniref:DNA mismatch repair protein MSH3 n=1 Tax=Exophiala aquamarina CBS 119918 TaxID=1182545 RepID=A0A072P8T3_9EURO|nr:DNA mismatch repair protein MSH4 [Exophiala aquamarina CBS 119918]KEF51995.1 DNA mismatch repair protein MSH4 [Exophiala aquamarina CBS 119918]